ncbi:hypothetical protein TYRP_004005 [Tyrophagus putrescentiae]|nr:hypothetical protein TYRP_004005 [Tyrophagus putrescentiae]
MRGHLLNQRLTGGRQKASSVGVKGVAVDGAQDAAGLGDNHSPGGHVPDAEAGVEEEVGGALRQQPQTAAAAADHPHRAGLPEDLVEEATNVGVAVLAAEEGHLAEDQRLGESVHALADVDGAAIAAGPPSLDGRVELAEEGRVDDAHHQLPLDGQADGDGDQWVGVREVHRPVDWVDDPGRRVGGDAVRRARGLLADEDVPLGVGGLQPLEDELLNRPVHLGDQVAAAAFLLH